VQDIVSISPQLAGSVDLQNQLKDSILATSTATGMSATDVTRGIYYAISAGKSLADAQIIVNDAARAGVAGMANTTDSTRLLTGVMNAYSLGTDQAGATTDKLFTIVKNGALRFSDLNSDLGKTTSASALAGVSINEVGGALDALTNKGNASAAANVQIQSLIAAISTKPSKTMQAEIGALGFDSGDQMIKKLGFEGALKELYDSAGGSSLALGKLFLNKNAIKGIGGLLGGQDEGSLWTKDSAALGNSAGATDEALAAQEQATSFHVNVMKAKFNELAIALGDGLRPAVSAVADVMGTLFSAFASIPAPILHIIGLVAGVASAFAVLVGGGALLETLFAGPLGAALGGVASSMIGLLLPIAAIAAGLFLLYEAFNHNLFGIKDAVVNAFNAISSAVSNGIKTYQDMISFGFNPFEAALFAIGAALDSIGLGGIGGFFTRMAQSLGDAINTFNAFRALGADPFMATMKGIASFFDSMGMAGMSGFFNDLANRDWGQALRDIASGALILLGALGNLALDLGGWVIHVGVPTVLGWLADLARDAWGALKAAAGFTGDVVADIASWTINVAAPGLIGWISEIAGDFWGWFKGKIGITDGGGDGTGMGTVQSMSFGGWVIDVLAPTLGGWVLEIAGNFWGWLKGKLGMTDGGGDGTGMGAVQTMSFGGWTMDVLAPIPGKIFDAATWLYNQIKTFSIGLFNVVVNVWSWGVGTIVPIATWLYGVVKDFSIGLFGIVVNVWGWGVGSIIPLATWLYGIVKDFSIGLFGVVVNVWGWGAGVIPNVASWLYGIVKDFSLGFFGTVVNIWGWAVGNIKDLGAWLLDQEKGVSLSLSTTLVSVANWGVGTIKDLAAWLLDQEKGVSLSLSTTLVSVSNWAPGAIKDLGAWLYGLLRATVVDLVSVMVNIANWTQGAWKDLGAWFVTRLQGFTADLTSVMVNIANWTQGAWKDLGTWLYGIVRDVKVFLVSVGVDISAWAQNLNWPDMGTWIKGELTKAGKIAVDVWDLINISTTVPDGTTANWTASGQTIGTAIATAVGHGIKAIFGFLTGGAPAHGGSGAGSSGDDISTAIDGFIKGFFTGAIQAAGTAIADYIEAIPAKMTSDFHKSVADNKSQIQTAFKLVTTIFDQIPDVDSTIKTAIDGFFGKVWTSVSTAFSSAWSSFTSKLNGLFSGGGSGLVANETGSNAFVGGGGNNGIWDGLIKALTPDLHISMPSLPGWLTDGTLLSPIKSLITTLGTTAKDLQTAWDALQKVINKVSGTGSGDASKTTWATGPVGGAGNRPSSLLSSPGGGFGAGGGFSDIPGVPPGGMFGGGGGGSSFSLPAPDTTAFLAAIATAKSAAMSLVATPFIAKFTADVSNAAFQFTQVMTWGGIWARTPFIGKFSGDVSNAARQFTQVMSWGTIWSTTAFIGKFLGDVANAAVQFTQVMTWGTIWGASSWTGKFLGDVSNAARQFTQVMTWGAIWGAFSSTGRFLGDVSNAAMQFTQVMTWGGIWGASSFTGKFDGDTSDAAKKYTDAFTWGDAWNAAVFTASFAIDTSGLIAASNTADAVAAHIAAIMPHSPAREGPLSQPITFDYIGDNFASMAGRLKQLASDSAGYIGSARGKGRLENATVISAINGAGRGMVTASPSGNRSGDTNLTLTVNFNGAQPDAQIVEKIKTAAVDAMAMALGHARAMQVGM